MSQNFNKQPERQHSNVATLLDQETRMNTITEHPASLEIPTVPGTPFAGGFYAGRFFIGADAYALIVAPKAEGEKAEIAWNKNNKAVKGALSYSDGAANTEAMAKAGSPLAKWTRELRIAGHDDWYLPSRLELLVAFGELRQVEAFDPDETDGFAKDWYWSSTQYAGNAAWAWFQDFSYGYQYGTTKHGELRARAVRRLVIE
jgi:hypothetical protein